MGSLSYFKEVSLFTLFTIGDKNKPVAHRESGENWQVRGWG